MHSNKKCEHFLESISNYIDGTLSEELCTALEAHMAVCTNCQIVIDTLKKTIAIYHDLDHHEEKTEEHLPAEVRNRLFVSLNLDEFLE
jgi:anti-sigma factor RsiW